MIPKPNSRRPRSGRPWRAPKLEAIDEQIALTRLRLAS
jgi:hypothetical protein